MKYLLSSLCLFYSLTLVAQIEKRCLNATHVQEIPSVPLHYYQRMNIDSQRIALDVNQNMQSGVLYYNSKNNVHSATNFIKDSFKEGDCFLYNSDELIHIKIEKDLRPKRLYSEGLVQLVNRWFWELLQLFWPTRRADFHPIIIYPAEDSMQKKFALLESKFIKYFNNAKHVEVTGLTGKQVVSDIKSYQKNNLRDAKVIFITCPKDRMSLCSLEFEDINFDVFARSRREDFKDPLKSSRLVLNGDTPQGIYTLWGRMNNIKPEFGNYPRFDLDAANASLNGSEYNTQSYLLEKLLPEDYRETYWAQELALAYSLGRIFLRIHENAINPENSDYYPTSGCINSGNNLSKLMNKLVEIGAFPAYDAQTSPIWEANKMLGKIFVIVKDY